ncbi:MAG: hypothetical protein HY689_09400 [Chloroflexi bacterium]|nr:hypothetical protein [Chloroflexota bacterium]
MPATSGPTKSDGIFTPNNNREIYQKISTDYQEIVKLTNQVTEGKPLPAGEILLLYEVGMHTRLGLNSRSLRMFAREAARAQEFAEESAFYQSATFLDDPVFAAIRGTGDAAKMTEAQRRQVIQKGLQRILYHWSRRYLEGAAKNGNAGWVEEGWAIYVGEEQDGKYPNSLAATALAREDNFNKKGSIDEPLRRAMAAGHKALLDKNTGAYQEALREMTSRFHALFYLASARYLNEALKRAQSGKLDNAGVQMAEGFSFYLSIQPQVAKADPEADKAIVDYYKSDPAKLTKEARDAALTALNRTASALLLTQSDLVTPADFQ